MQQQNWTAKDRFTVIKVKLPMTYQDKTFEKIDNEQTNKTTQKKTTNKQTSKRHHLMSRGCDISISQLFVF